MTNNPDRAFDAGYKAAEKNIKKMKYRPLTEEEKGIYERQLKRHEEDAEYTTYMKEQLKIRLDNIDIRHKMEIYDEKRKLIAAISQFVAEDEQTKFAIKDCKEKLEKGAPVIEVIEDAD